MMDMVLDVVAVEGPIFPGLASLRSDRGAVHWKRRTDSTGMRGLLERTNHKRYIMYPFYI